MKEQVLQNEPAEIKYYNLINPNHLKIVKDFERELGNRSFHEFCLNKGFYKGEPPVMVISKLREYEDAKKKSNALIALKRSRKLAQEHEEINVASIPF